MAVEIFKWNTTTLELNGKASIAIDGEINFKYYSFTKKTSYSKMFASRSLWKRYKYAVFMQNLIPYLKNLSIQIEIHFEYLIIFANFNWAIGFFQFPYCKCEKYHPACEFNGAEFCVKRKVYLSNCLNNNKSKRVFHLTDWSAPAIITSESIL